MHYIMLYISCAGIPGILARLISLFIGARTMEFYLTIEVKKVIQLINDSANLSIRFFAWNGMR